MGYPQIPAVSTGPFKKAIYFDNSKICDLFEYNDF